MQYDCTFYAGEPAVDETIVAAGHEPNGYFWEGMLRYLEPELAEQVELDSEGGMFAAFGRRRQMQHVQSVLAPYLVDSGLVADTVSAAERAGFQLGD
jgi:hypothetical protein